MPRLPENRATSGRPRGQAGKRTTEQTEDHRAQIARLLRAEPGITNNELARRLGMNEETVRRDREFMLAELRRARTFDLEAHADHLYADLRAWLGEAWKGWEASRKEQEQISATEEEDSTNERVERQSIGGPMHGATTSGLVPVATRKRTRHSVKRSTSPGDPRFIAMGLKANAGLVELLGLAGRGAPATPPSTDLAELAQSNPAFMADMLAALDRAGLLNHAALTAGEEEDDEEGGWVPDEREEPQPAPVGYPLRR